MTRSEDDFKAEIEAHIALETDQLMAEGLIARDARDLAIKRFGGVVVAEERFYESRRVMWLDHLRRDAGYAVRSFLRSPVFTVTAVLSLAIGIGVDTAVFTVANGLLLRPLPEWSIPIGSSTSAHQPLMASMTSNKCRSPISSICANGRRCSRTSTAMRPSQRR